MSETTKDILRNYNDDPVPQYYNSTTDAYEVQKGASGSSFVAVKSIDAGTNIIGKFGIDQTTDGTTNRTVAKISQVSGENGITVTGNVGTNSTLQNAANTNANGTVMAVSQYATVGFDISGTFVGTVNFEVSNDQTNWYSVNTTQSGTKTIANTATAPGIYYANVTSVQYVRARISGYTSGSITVKAYADPSVRPEKTVNCTIDQSVDAQTNRVVSKISQTVGENIIVLGAGSAIAGKMGLDTAANTVKIDASNNTVKIDSANNDVDVLSLPGAAHHSPVSGNPVRIGVRALTANYPVVDTGDTADLVSTLTGSLITKPYSIPESDWQFNCSAAITNTTDVAVKASAGAGLRNYITSFQYQNTNATATEVVIKDGSSTVIWRGYAPANMTALANVQLLTPLKGSAATAINFACITTSASVYFNAQGYQAP